MELNNTVIGVMGKRPLFEEGAPEDKNRGYVTFDMCPPAGVSFQGHIVNFHEAVSLACRFIMPNALECELLVQRARKLRIVSGRFGVRLMTALPHFVMGETLTHHADKTTEFGKFLDIPVFESAAVEQDRLFVVDKGGHTVIVHLLNCPWFA